MTKNNTKGNGQNKRTAKLFTDERRGAKQARYCYNCGTVFNFFWDKEASSLYGLDDVKLPGALVQFDRPTIGRETNFVLNFFRLGL